MNDEQHKPVETDALLGQQTTGLAFTQHQLPWVARLVYNTRVDLQEKFDLDSESGLFDFTVWLLNAANDQLKSLIEEPEFIHFCAMPMMMGRSMTVLQTVVYISAKELHERYELPRDEAAYVSWFEDTFKQTGHGGLARVAKILLGVEPMPLGLFAHLKQRTQPSKHPFGINVIGYAYGQLGIGEDARMTAKALKKLGVPFCLVDFKPGPTIPLNDYSMHAHVLKTGPYSINLFCMTATETARYFLFEGAEQFLDRTNIGYWPWELNHWPQKWLPCNDLVDEVWVGSKHIHDALKPVFQKPLRIVPLHVDVSNISPLSRRDFGLPETAKLFVFSFDLHSSVHRKNPHDCLKAFLTSFPLGDERYTREAVGLVIKTHRPKRHSADWENLKKLASTDDRIHIIEHTLSRPDLLALYSCCDCFLSMHRAEGYGRGIAEAIMLGLEVVTTNYSGNVDFCKPPQCTLVDYELVPVLQGQYIEGAGMHWAGNLKLPQLSATRKHFTSQ